MKHQALFWKKLMVMILAAAMAFSGVLPAAKVYAAGTEEIEETETFAAEAAEAEEDRTAEQEAASRQVDDLVAFTFLTPATKVILDGEPLMILPDTLTAHLEYYDSNGSLSERDIRYTSDAARTGASWSALQYFLGTGRYDLDPAYDSSTGGWYYMIRGTRYDVPMQEIALSSSDARELPYGEDFWGTNDEWVKGKVSLYKITADEAVIWADLHMYQTPSDSSYVTRGSRLGGACTFSKEAAADDTSHHTGAGEPYYYANLYYGSQSWLQVDCRYTCEPDYIGTPVYDITVEGVDGNGTSFEFTSIIREEGWYRVAYSIVSAMKGSTQVKLDPTTCDTSIEQGIFERNPDAWGYMTNRSEPMYLPRGAATFHSSVSALSTTDYYEKVYLDATVEKLEAGDIVTGKLGVIPYGSRNDPWNWNRTSGEYTYGFEDMYFSPIQWGDYDYVYPSPASLTGRIAGDCLSFKYASYMKSSNGNQEYYPFSFCKKVPFSKMELEGNTLLRYSLSDFGEITAQLLDPSGEPEDLTSTEEMAYGKHTMHIVCRTGDTVTEEQNVLIGIPPRNKYEILEADDISITYDADLSPWGHDYEEFTQSAEDPNEYMLNISSGYANSYPILDELMLTLSMQVSYQQTLTELVRDDNYYVTDMITSPGTMEETSILLYDVVQYASEGSNGFPAYLGDPYIDDSDYLDVHLYDRDGTTEYTDLWHGRLAPGNYLMTITSGMHQYEKRIYITLKGHVAVQSIVFSEPEITLRPNRTYQLQYVVNPSDASYPELTWEVETEADGHHIIWVEDGVIETGGDEGDATVTAYAENGTISASCLVHVRKKKLDSVTISETEITLRPLEKVQLDYEILPEDNDYPWVWWTTEDDEVATVEDGLVEAVWLGDTNVTLHAQSGEITAICKVHVVQYPVGRIVAVEDETWSEVSDGGTINTCTGVGGCFFIHYLAKTVLGNEYWLEEEDSKNWTVSITNSNPSVIQVDASDIFAPSYNAIKQGRSVLTINVKGDGWEKTAKFNILVQFQDVREKSKYYYEPVYWAADQKITNGYGGWQFGVGYQCTREDMVTFLWRMQGKPAVTADDKKKYHFPDVESGKYYENAVVWAAKNNITKGYSSGAHKGKFGVGLNVTREEAVTFLYRAAGSPAVSAADLKKYTFNDIKSTAYYAKPVAWAAKNNIAKGYSSGAYAGKFGVGLKVKREDIVTFMWRYKVK